MTIAGDDVLSQKEHQTDDASSDGGTGTGVYHSHSQSTSFTDSMNKTPDEEADQGLDIDWAMVLSIILTTSLAITSAVAWLLFGSTDYGLRTIREGPYLSGLVYGLTLLLNFLAGLVVFASAIVRRRLLSPSPQELRRMGRRNSPSQSLLAWRAAPLPRKLLWLIMLVTSLSTHLFVNMLVTDTTTSYEAYQVLVDERFFLDDDGVTSFDVASVNLTQFPDEPDAVMPYGRVWPDDWPGASELQRSLQALRENPAAWANLSANECGRQYGRETYSDFRNVVMVTNWTGGYQTFDDNAALAVGALPASLHFTLRTRFKMLCPAAYIETTPSGFFPDSSKYVEELPASGSNEESEGRYFRQKYDVEERAVKAMRRAHDMCYDYRPQQPEAYNWTEQLALSYCLSEPMSASRGRAVWNTYTSGILAVILIIMAVTMSGAWLLVRYDGGFKGGGYPWPECRRGPWTAAGAYVVTSLIFAVLATVLVCWGRYLFYHGQSPRDSRDSSFTLGITVYANLLHPVLALREVLQANMYDRFNFIKYEDRHKGIKGPREPRLDAYNVVSFVLDLGLHMFATAWTGVSLEDRYPLSAVGDSAVAPVPHLKPIRSPFDSDLLGLVWTAPPLVLAFHGCAILLLWTPKFRRYGFSI